MKLGRKEMATLQAILVFYIISHPMLYRLTDSLLGGLVGPLVTMSGVPTMTGMLVHAAVFGVVVRLMMN
jgi:ABC-type Mn2+/Zn2+ transport system permease subunit